MVSRRGHLELREWYYGRANEFKQTADGGYSNRHKISGKKKNEVVRCSKLMTLIEIPETRGY